MENTKLNTLKQKGILDNDTTSLDKYSFANLFNVVNKGTQSYFNITKGLQLVTDVIDASMYGDHQILQGDTWTNISYKYYGTYKLWWLICKFNNIKNPFTDLIVGNIIKIPDQNTVNTILELIGK